MNTVNEALEHLRKADTQNEMTPDTYRAVTLLSGAYNDALNKIDDLEQELEAIGDYKVLND